MCADAPHIQSLKDSTRPLEAFYNEHTDTPRFLAILSPTCPGCITGATAIRDAIRDDCLSADLEVGLIWIPMLATDTEATTEQAAANFADYETTHFVDPNRIAGRWIAESVGAEDGIAWDIYLFYDSHARWENGPPEPVEWVHQLAPSSWTPPERYRCGEDLTSALGQLMHQMVHQNDPRSQPADTP